MKNLMLIAVSLVGFQAWGNGLELGLPSRVKLPDYVEAVRMGSAFCSMNSLKIKNISYNIPELKDHNIWYLSSLIGSVRIENFKNNHLMTFSGKGIDSAVDRYDGQQLYAKLITNFDFFNSFEIEVYTDDRKSHVTGIIVKTYKIRAVNAGTLLEPQFLNESQQYVVISYKCN